MSIKSTARAAAALESQFMSQLSGWKLANQELDQLSSQRQTSQSRLEELQLVASELEMLEDDAMLYQMVGPLLTSISVAEGRRINANRTKTVKEDVERYGRRIRALGEQQRERRIQLAALQQKLPNVPDAVYEL